MLVTQAVSEQKSTCQIIHWVNIAWFCIVVIERVIRAHSLKETSFLHKNRFRVIVKNNSQNLLLADSWPTVHYCPMALYDTMSQLLTNKPCCEVGIRRWRDIGFVLVKNILTFKLSFKWTWKYMPPGSFQRICIPYGVLIFMQASIFTFKVLGIKDISCKTKLFKISPLIAPSKKMWDSIWRLDFCLAQSMSCKELRSCSISCSISRYIVVQM